MVTTWTNIPKQTSTGWTDVPGPTDGASTVIHAGEPIGLLLALTYANTIVIPTNIWTDIIKANGTGWTNIAKAT